MYITMRDQSFRGTTTSSSFFLIYPRFFRLDYVTWLLHYNVNDQSFMTDIAIWHCCIHGILAGTCGLSKLSQKDEERKEILHESVKHAIL